ncbi:hypothetical protein A2Y85_08360 [candidate division WOR-3 bacterium RBG_13_43_14]|uniref:Uncharacterized protein n=1 Tax=candidate division WOR-3 bacterium RBG_13_43_14 TaxID=1802590 RepID=A0A1F4U2S6_UNCW3|nr:MAG: hypothetical protein A2Y85_08360 [candidate division WOR-3 bacterium RBG_13_43_14]
MKVDEIMLLIQSNMILRRQDKTRDSSLNTFCIFISFVIRKSLLVIQGWIRESVNDKQQTIIEICMMMFESLLRRKNV